MRSRYPATSTVKTKQQSQETARVVQPYLRRVGSESRQTRMADEGTEPIKLSEASVERVAGRLAELVAPRLLSQNPAGSSSHTTEEEGGSQKGEKHVYSTKAPRGGLDMTTGEGRFIKGG